MKKLRRSLWAILLGLLMSACSSMPSVDPAIWSRDEGSGLAARVITAKELKFRYGLGPDENPFLAMKGMLFGGLTFAVLEVENQSTMDVQLLGLSLQTKEATVLGEFETGAELVKYWEPVKKYADSLESKKTIIEKEYIRANLLLPSKSRKVILFKVNEGLPENFVLLLQDGSADTLLPLHRMDIQ